ncbi:TetR/AcrR family transcriptional regulator [Pullulanibacillus sp. KACC 23026]|uniref:TetR/AcrR family transcriptional regulator n=1 Tax=Pullulanibacillus sp. KACC 23026 TaxID=3028315 RepID=UPI0023AFB211|nr:TetR/AcrR family transcriptional regulator [Pullulanibacillus sp. KACC 23026]WEG13087.1 TetR/AcrR family transcriptional regulator [Pullulanibacillus sp. KACC 23026]
MAQKNVETQVKDEELIRKRRSQLVQAAVKLFTEKGFHRTTTREIAKASGFSIGTLYEYIRSKEDALYLVCDDIYTQFSDRLRDSIVLKEDGLSSLKEAIEACIDMMNDMQDEVLVMYQEAKSLSKDALPYVLNKENEMASFFGDILDYCVECKVFQLSEKEKTLISHQILVQCQMWAFRRWSLHREMTLEEFKTIQVKTIFNGLQAFRPTGTPERSNTAFLSS